MNQNEMDKLGVMVSQKMFELNARIINAYDEMANAPEGEDI